jgi:hypothetical protein
MQELIPLNQLTGLRLFVTLAACEGVWGMQMLQPTERSAFLALFGPHETIDEDPLVEGMQAFYTSMFKDGTGNAAFKAANDAVGGAKPAFAMVNCEMAFRMVYGDFLRERCTPVELARRAESILHGLRWRFFIDHGRPMPIETFTMLQARTKQHVENYDAYFVEMRHNYFFYDLMPANATRFPVTLRDCLREEY